jgi:hypothetical protein
LLFCLQKNATTKNVASKTAKLAGKSKIQEMRAAMRAKMAEKKRQLVTQDNEVRLKSLS